MNNKSSHNNSIGMLDLCRICNKAIKVVRTNWKFIFQQLFPLTMLDNVVTEIYSSQLEKASQFEISLFDFLMQHGYLLIFIITLLAVICTSTLQTLRLFEVCRYLAGLANKTSSLKRWQFVSIYYATAMLISVLVERQTTDLFNSVVQGAEPAAKIFISSFALIILFLLECSENLIFGSICYRIDSTLISAVTKDTKRFYNNLISYLKLAFLILLLRLPQHLFYLLVSEFITPVEDSIIYKCISIPISTICDLFVGCFFLLLVIYMYEEFENRIEGLDILERLRVLQRLE